MWRNFFYFSKNERRGMIALILLIMLFKSGAYWYKKTESEKAYIVSETALRDYELFLTSLEEKKNVKVDPIVDSQQPLYKFDPNTLDSIGFINLGLSSFATSNILKYRRKQGRFKQPQDLARIYGVSSQTFAELSPWIHIKELPRENTVADNQILSHKEEPDPEKTFIKETNKTIRPFKYARGTTLNLNDADTAELRKIPGIGSGIARTIVTYRYKLGGFTKLHQLQDIPYIPDTLNQWFYIAPNFEAKRIDLNKASVERLTAHPYLNFYQAKAIVEYRKKNGKLKNLKQLALYEEFSSDDMDRLNPYLSFE